MKKNEFFKSPQCKSGKYCAICRSKDKVSFRTTVQKRYNDVTDVDFTCPYGKQWNEKEDKEKQDREKVKKRMQELAEFKNKKRAQAKEKKNNIVLQKQISQKQITPLTYKYIFKNEEIFSKIDGYKEEKEKINAAVKKAEDAGRCSSCTRNRLNRTIERN